MTVESVGLFVSGSTWKTNKNMQGSAGVKTKASNHAEMLTYRLLNSRRSAKGAFLIVQNAFPCEKCHNWFKASLGTQALIIKVEDNQGSYSMDHGLAARVTNFPYYIYYHNGAATRSNGAVGPPAGFPAHPAPTVSYF